MKKMLILILAGSFVLGPSGQAFSQSKGEYMTYGVICAIGSVGLVVAGGAVLSNKPSDDDGTVARKGGLMILGGVILAGVSAYCFNHAMKTYGAMLNIDNGAVALGFPELRYDFSRDMTGCRLVEARF